MRDYALLAPSKGDRLSAAWAAKLVQAANHQHVSTGPFVDNEAGFLVMPPHAANADLTPFEMFDDIAPGNTDKYAWLLQADLTRDSSADKVYVSDQILGDVRAYGSSHSGFTTGAKGFYTLGSNGKNQVVSIERLAKLIRGSGPGTTVAANASYTLSSPVALDDGQLPGTTITVTNYSTALPASATNVTVVADGAGGYRTLDGPCP